MRLRARISRKSHVSMKSSRRLQTARVLFPLLAIVACARPARDPEPARLDPVEPPPAEISTFVIPIRTSLAPLVPQVEAQVPPAIQGRVTERGIDVEYDVRRDPIQITAIGAGIHASSAVHYNLQACRGRFPCVSCGIDEPRRSAEIKLHSALNWSADWRLHSTTRVLPVHYRTPCAITWFDIDVTRRFVAPVVERELAKIATMIDRQTPRLTSIRPQAETIWRALQEPIETAPRTWLVIEPEAVALSPIGGSGSTVTTTLHLRTKTRMAVGNRPAVIARPLATLSSMAESVTPQIRVPLDLHLPYAEATRLATTHYSGKTFRVNGRPLTIRALDISPLRDGRVRIDADVDYRGGALRNYDGPVVLEGTPRFDPATARIIIPDLEYSLESRRGLLARLAERALHDEIRNRLRETARLDLGRQLAEARVNVSRALQRTLAPGVRLDGTVTSIAVSGLIVHPDALYVRLVAEGEAKVEIAAR